MKTDVALGLATRIVPKQNVKFGIIMRTRLNFGLKAALIMLLDFRRQIAHFLAENFAQVRHPVGNNY